MKLNKQPGAKLALVASTLALLCAFFALVRSQPQVNAAATLEPAAKPSGSYQDFFFPATPSAGGQTQPLAPAPRPHTRTRSS